MERVVSIVDRFVNGGTMFVGVGFVAWALSRLYSVEASVLFVGLAMIAASGLSIVARHRKPRREPKEGGV